MRSVARQAREGNGIEKALNTLYPKVDQIQEATMNVIYEEEVRGVPFLTGALMSSIEKKQTGPDTREVSSGGEKAPHGVHVNNGTEKMAANPYHDNAAQTGRRYMNDQYKKL